MKSDPHRIDVNVGSALAALTRSERDAEFGRYEQPLQGFLHFYNSALKRDPSLAGVRGSFFVSAWRSLADKYPPAMDALLDARDCAERAFLYNGYPYADFDDLCILNKVLGSPERTVAMFRTARRVVPEQAARLYRLAQDSFIGAGEFALCGEYLDPFRELECLLTAARSVNVEGIYTAVCKKLKTLVALLVRNNRAAEAWRVAREASVNLPKQNVMEALADALEGKFPL